MQSTAVDYELVAAQLLRALRGRRSQVAFARRLGFASNVPYTWESGRRFPRASTFLDVAARVGVDVEAALASFAGATWPRDDRALELRLLSAVVGTTAHAEVGARTGLGRQAVGRWLRGASMPRLPDLLRLVDGTTHRMLDLVAAFVDPEAVPSLRAPWRKLAAARALVRTTPWASAVLLCLDLEAYRELPRHRRGWIAARLGIDTALEDVCLDLLVGAGQVRRVRGRLIAPPTAPMDARGAAPTTDLKRFWGEVALARGADGLVSWNLFTVSVADLEALRDLQRDAFRRMRGRVASSPPEVLALAHWTLCVVATGDS